MTKRLCILTYIVVLGISGCGREYYINEGCELGTEVVCEENVIYTCVNAKDEGLDLDKFIDPEFDKPNNTYKDVKLYWKRVQCVTYCSTDSAECVCPDTCVNGCEVDGSCKLTQGCQNGHNDDGTCACDTSCQYGCDASGTRCCDEKCQNGCEANGACSCPETCVNGCNEDGSACTCKEQCVEGTTCDTGTGKCACLKKCKGRCDSTGQCGENQNHMNDQYETVANQGKDCRKDSDCDSAEGAGDGFCDSFIGYKCSTRCTSDEQCVDDEFNYICRPDGRCAPESFVTVWRIADKLKLLIPTSQVKTCNFDIDWGDGTKYEKCIKTKDDILSCANGGTMEANEKDANGNLLHVYQKEGDYIVKITGQYDGFGWPVGNENGVDLVYPYEDKSPSKLIEIKSFGPVGLGEYAFAFCGNLALFSTVDIPDATKMNDMRNAFYSATPACEASNNCEEVNYFGKFDTGIENWDMSHVTNMRGMFNLAKFFNSPIDKWDTSNVTDMSYMFAITDNFNQPIGNWDTSNVTDMSWMFLMAREFNHPIRNWDTSNVTTMSRMFASADVFNQPIDSWNTSNVTDMNNMFSNAKSFNQPINSWNTSNVTDMSEMFSGANAFNRPLDKWKTIQVVKMNGMFRKASAFDQDLSAWKFNKLVETENMFQNSGITKDNYCKIVEKLIEIDNYNEDLGKDYECQDP